VHVSADEASSGAFHSRVMAMLPNDTEMGGSRRSFPTTHWSLLVAVRGEMTEGHRAVLNLLIERYWKPVYCYVRRRGHGNEDAKDLVQEFFTSWLHRDLFGQANPNRGRFRSFLLSCLSNFLSNAHRAAHAARRRPEKGFVSVHQLTTGHKAALEPVDQDTPEAAFQRAWAEELVLRVLKRLERECSETAKPDHYELFRQRIIRPALEGCQAPPMADLAKGLGLTEKQAANRLVTARRAYQRLLREEIRTFATSEDDMAAEIQDLSSFLTRR
jgi:RNA polymerase sigma-70 factor (ECF subfamily)